MATGPIPLMAETRSFPEIEVVVRLRSRTNGSNRGSGAGSGVSTCGSIQPRSWQRVSTKYRQSSLVARMTESDRSSRSSVIKQPVSTSSKHCHSIDHCGFPRPAAWGMRDRPVSPSPVRHFGKASLPSERLRARSSAVPRHVPDCAETRRWLMPRLGMHGMRAVSVAEGYRRHRATDRAPFAAAAGQEGNILALDQACTARISPCTPTRLIARLRL